MIRHRPSHWILVALVIVAAVFVFREVHGQTSTNARSMFEGLPAMAGAQAGLGAQAGPPQGGIGVQGSDAVGLRLRRPSGLDEPRSMPQGQVDEPVVAINDSSLTLPPSAPRPERRGDERVGERLR